MDYPVKTLSQLRPILQGFRKAAGLTQAMMAARLGVTQQTYAQLEANPAAVSVERLFKVLRVLGVEFALTQATARPAQDDDAVATAAPPVASKMAASKKIAAKPLPGRAKRQDKQAFSKPTRKRAAIGKNRENW